MAQTSSKQTKTSKWENDIIEMEDHHTTETMQKKLERLHGFSEGTTSAQHGVNRVLGKNLHHIKYCEIGPVVSYDFHSRVQRDTTLQYLDSSNIWCNYHFHRDIYIYGPWKKEQ